MYGLADDYRKRLVCGILNNWYESEFDGPFTIANLFKRADSNFECDDLIGAFCDLPTSVLEVLAQLSYDYDRFPIRYGEAMLAAAEDNARRTYSINTIMEYLQ